MINNNVNKIQDILNNKLVTADGFSILELLDLIDFENLDNSDKELDKLENLVKYKNKEWNELLDIIFNDNKVKVISLSYQIRLVINSFIKINKFGLNGK